MKWIGGGIYEENSEDTEPIALLQQISYPKSLYVSQAVLVHFKYAKDAAFILTAEERPVKSFWILDCFR